jgi:hypothetical protein
MSDLALSLNSSINYTVVVQDYLKEKKEASMPLKSQFLNEIPDQGPDCYSPLLSSGVSNTQAFDNPLPNTFFSTPPPWLTEASWLYDTSRLPRRVLPLSCVVQFFQELGMVAVWGGLYARQDCPSIAPLSANRNHAYCSACRSPGPGAESP